MSEQCTCYDKDAPIKELRKHRDRMLPVYWCSHIAEDRMLFEWDYKRGKKVWIAFVDKQPKGAE